VERREKFDLIFSEVMTTRNLEVHLTNLIEGQFYQFRVKAVSEAGIGPPCEPTVFQACKQRQSMIFLLILFANDHKSFGVSSHLFFGLR